MFHRHYLNLIHTHIQSSSFFNSPSFSPSQDLSLKLKVWDSPRTIITFVVLSVKHFYMVIFLLSSIFLIRYTFMVDLPIVIADFEFHNQNAGYKIWNKKRFDWNLVTILMLNYNIDVKKTILLFIFWQVFNGFSSYWISILF